MAKSRDELLKYAKRRYIEVDGVRIQSLTELELSELRTRWAIRYEKSKEIDLVMRRETIAAVIVDDSGSRMFSESEVHIIAEWDGAITERIYRAAREHCGFNDADEVNTQEKKSEPTTVSV